MRSKGGRRTLGVALAGLMLASQLLVTTAPAVACDRSQNAEVIAHLGGSDLGKVVVSGTVAYAAAKGGVVVFDVATASAPKVLAQIPLPGDVEDITLAGSYLYAVGSWGDMQIVDVSDPSAPVKRGATGWGSAMHSVRVSGDRAYVTSDGHGFKVVDISDRDDPYLVSYVGPPTSAEYYDIALSGTKAYVSYGSAADNVRRIRVFDVSDPDATPVRIGATDYVVPAGVSIRSLTTSGALVFAGESGRGLDVVDFTTPAAPSHIATYTPTFGAGTFDVQVTGGVAYLADGGGGMQTLDVSNPAGPALLAGLGGTYSGVAVAAGKAYLTGGRTLTVADVSDPSSPGTLGSVSLKPADAKDVAYAGGFAYVAAGADGLLKVSVDETAGATVVGSADLSDASRVVVSGDHAYVADGATLKVFDVSGSGDPVFIGSQPTASAILQMSIDGNRLYAALGGNGLAVYSLADAAHPAVVGSYDDPDSPINAVTAAGGRVYVGVDGGAVVSLNAADPAHVSELSRMSTYGDVISLSVDGDQLYAGTAIPDRTAAEDGKVYLVDASDPSDLMEINHVWMDGSVRAVKAAGPYAYAATDQGFSLIDFSDAGNPYEATFFGQGEIGFGGVDVDGDVAYLAGRNDGFYALRVSVLRTAGPTRYETAVELSKANWDTAGNVVLATGGNFADAACSAPLAHELGGPLLLVKPTGITPEVLAEIQRLAEGSGGIGAMHVTIIGSTGAVGAGCETALRGIGVASANIKRLAGWNRYDTARLVAHEWKTAHGSNPATAFLATGENFPDALSVSGVAAAIEAPVLLTKASSVPTPTMAAISDLGHPRLVAVGGSGVIGPLVYGRLGCVDRIAGDTRFDTAKKVADYGLGHGFSPEEVIVTTGRNFPDALVVGVVSAKHGSPILLTDSDLPDGSASFIDDHRGAIKKITVVGAPGAVSQAVEDAIVDHLTGQ